MWRQSAVSGLTGGFVLILSAACGGAARQPAAGAGPQPDGTTGAVTAVSEDQRPANDQSITEFLRGRVPGLQIVPGPDGSLRVQIRGGGVQEPLVVINGAPVQPQALGRVLAALNPNDITRVEVLKDVASTAMYGSRGAYGVLLIDTRGN